MVQVPCKNPRRPKVTTVLRIPVILPHELFSWLSQNNRFYVSRDVIHQFWQQWKKHKPYHPASESGVHNPVGISGDDARYTLGGAKVIVICCNLVLVDRARRSQSNDINTHGYMHHILAYSFGMCSLLFYFQTHNKLESVYNLYVPILPFPGLDVNRYLLASIRCELSLGPATLDPIYKVIAWSLNALWCFT